jgi:hypothetical protein
MRKRMQLLAILLVFYPIYMVIKYRISKN